MIELKIYDPEPKKSCRGCKHLVSVGSGFVCKGDEQLMRCEEALTGRVWYEDSRFPHEHGRRPTPADMRSPKGRCGPDRKFYEPSVWARLFPWFFST